MSLGAQGHHEQTGAVLESLTNLEYSDTSSITKAEGVAPLFPGNLEV